MTLSVIVAPFTYFVCSNPCSFMGMALPCNVFPGTAGPFGRAVSLFLLSSPPSVSGRQGSRSLYLLRRSIRPAGGHRRLPRLHLCGNIV